MKTVFLIFSVLILVVPNGFTQEKSFAEYYDFDLIHIQQMPSGEMFLKYQGKQYSSDFGKSTELRDIIMSDPRAAELLKSHMAHSTSALTYFITGMLTAAIGVGVTTFAGLSGSTDSSTRQALAIGGTAGLVGGAIVIYLGVPDARKSSADLLECINVFNSGKVSEYK